MARLPRSTAAAILLASGLAACSGSGKSAPTSPTGATRTGMPQGPALSVTTSATPAASTTSGGANAPRPAASPLAGGILAGEAVPLTTVVAFPPRNEPFEFRLLLERKYRDDLRRAPAPSFVDNEGSIVWTQEYLRYRVNGCAHSEASQRVLFQVTGGGILPVCGESASGAITFPPRDEPFDFRLQLERAYRDGLRRTASDTAVDIEGDIVWTQEYLRYRVNGCNHTEAADRVFLQIDGRGVAPVCRATPPGTPDPNAPYQYAVNPTEVSTTADTVNLSVAVLTNRPDAQWTATSDQPWLTIDYGNQGMGDGRVYYRVANNLSSSARTGRITVSGLSGLYPPAIHTVRQAGR